MRPRPRHSSPEQDGPRAWDDCDSTLDRSNLFCREPQDRRALVPNDEQQNAVRFARSLRSGTELGRDAVYAL